MEEFKKPERLVIDAIPYLTEIMGTGLIKDLQEGECSMCPYCNQSWNEEYPTMTCNLGFDIFKCKLEVEEVKEGVENNGE